MEGGKVPAVKERQFYKDDYGSMMKDYEKRLQHNATMPNKNWEKKKSKLRKWTEADQLFEDALWAS
jgi:hypothetical protein